MSQQAHAVLVALRQLHSINHPVNDTVPWGNIARGTLGIEALHILMQWEPLKDLAGLKPEDNTTTKYYSSALGGGRNRALYFRWAVERILHPRLMSQISSTSWGRKVLDEMTSVTAELQRATAEIDSDIMRKGQQKAEGVRFNALLDLLEECFRYTGRHLRVHIEHQSRLGVDELGIIANEIDIVYCSQQATNLCGKYLKMREKKEPRHICFKHIAQRVIERLANIEHSILLDNALRVMLKVIPTLDALILETLCAQDWYMTLKDHGMIDEAEAFHAAMDDNPSLHSDANTPKDKRSTYAQSSIHMPSASMKGDTYFHHTGDYSPRRKPQTVVSAVEDDDDDESTSSAPTVRNGTERAPVAPVESTLPKNKVDSWEAPMPQNGSAAWKGMVRTMPPPFREHTSKQSTFVAPSWRDPYVNIKGAGLNKPGPTSVRHHAPTGRHSNTLVNNEKISRHQPSIQASITAGQVPGRRTLAPAAARIPKKSQLFTTPLGSSVPQRHVSKPFSAATIKQEPTQDDIKNVPTTHVSNNMYTIPEMSTEESARFDSWVNVHKEYISWPRSLIIEHKIPLTLENKQRRAFLEELLTAERHDRLAFEKDLDDSEREAVSARICDCVRPDIRAIRQAVQTARVRHRAAKKAANKAKERARKQGLPLPEPPSPPLGRTLGQIIDLMEGHEGFEEAIDKDGDSVMSDER